jgi:hypothetical protein
VEVSVAFADAVRKMLRTRVDEAWEGLWKRVITSRVLCWVCQSQSSLPLSSGVMRRGSAYKAEHCVRVSEAGQAAILFYGGMVSQCSDVACSSEELALFSGDDD